jgi:hypothetical protein
MPQASPVGSEGLEPSPIWLRARHAAANTLIPFRLFVALSVRAKWARRESNPRPDPYKRSALTTELCARVGPKGVEPLPVRLKGGSATVTPRPRIVEWAYPFEMDGLRHRKFSAIDKSSPGWSRTTADDISGHHASVTPPDNKSVGMVGLEPTLSCSQGTWACHYPTSRLCHTLCTQNEPRQRAPATEWVGRRSNPRLRLFRPLLYHLSYRPVSLSTHLCRRRLVEFQSTKKGPMSLRHRALGGFQTAGRPSVTSAEDGPGDSRRAASAQTAEYLAGRNVPSRCVLGSNSVV